MSDYLESALAKIHSNYTNTLYDYEYDALKKAANNYYTADDAKKAVRHEAKYKYFKDFEYLRNRDTKWEDRVINYRE